MTFLNKRITNTFVPNDKAVTSLVFFYDSVFSNIYKECEAQVVVSHNVTTVGLHLLKFSTDCFQ